MKKRLDLVDLEILEAIGIGGPRNQSAVARKLGIKDATLRARLKRLRSHIFLNANVYHTFIGLRKACVLAEAVLGKENLLFDAMKANDFWLYVSRCYGRFEGCFAIYTTPPENETEFKEFNLGVIDLGALVCRPKSPHHEICPISEDCRFFKSRAPRKQGTLNES